MRLQPRFVLVAFVALSACAPGPTVSEPTDGSSAIDTAQIRSDVQVVDNVVVVDDELANVDDTSVSLAPNAKARRKWHAGDYVVSGAGDGFIRRVVSVEQGDDGSTR